MAVTINGSTGWTYSDNIKHKYGTGEDLEIFHESDQNYLTSSNGRINLRASESRFENAAGNEVLAKFIDGGACELRYNDSAKLVTTDTGVKIQNAGNNRVLKLDHTDGDHCYITFMDDDTSDDGQVRVGALNNDLLLLSGGTETARFTSSAITFKAPDGGNRYFFGEMGDSASAQLSLYDSSDTQQVRISAGGANNEDSFFLSQKVTIGTTNGGDTSGIGIKLSGDDQVIPHATTTANTSTGGHSTWHFYNTNASYNGYRFYVKVNGGVINHSGNNENLCDEREKKDITDAPSQLSNVKAWKLRNFRYKTEADSEPLKFGVIAQEIETVNPDLVGEDFKVRVDDDGNDVLRKGVKEEQMMMISIKALQEAITKIETLETEVDTLKAKVAALEGA